MEDGQQDSPAVGVYHDHISKLAAVGHQVVRQLVRRLVDLPVAKDALGVAGALGLYDAGPLGVLLRIGGEDVVDSWAGRRQFIPSCPLPAANTISKTT